MNIRTILAGFFAAGLAIIALDVTAAQSSANFATPADAVNNGVSEMGSASYKLFSSVGDGFSTATPLTSASYSSSGGFLPQAVPAVVDQAITFGVAPTIIVGGTGTVSATGGGSGNPVAFTSLTTAFCTVGGDTVTGVKAGNCRIAANQAGDAHYNAAPQVTQDIAITASALSLIDLSVTQVAAPNPVLAGKDVTFTYTLANAGPAVASSITLVGAVPAAASFVWASPGCSQAAGTVTCNVASLASGASTQLQVILRAVAGSITNSVNASSAQSEPDYTDNASSLSVTVSAAPSAVAVLRYRLYSPVTQEHLFTTDLNEYNVLGSYVGTWVQEGTSGKVLNNPGSFNGVTAVPYYRLYDSATRWHHWTTDANEYYTLAQAPNWHAEGVDGYILPTATAGATQLYRLNYPALGSLHHWTIDANEYNTLITPAYGWVGEGGSGFVIQ